jgi:hypothetical protein
MLTFELGTENGSELSAVDTGTWGTGLCSDMEKTLNVAAI